MQLAHKKMTYGIKQREKLEDPGVKMEVQS
jgi:hypothetical protein